MKRCLTLLLALVLALSLAACGAKSAGPDTMTGDYNGYESAKEDYDFSATDDEPEGAGAWNGDGQVGSGIDKSLSERGVKMIYSAHIEMQTLSYEQAVEDIAALVERSGAYFEQKNFSNYSSGYRHASYTVRVPAEQFADFCAQVGTLCHVTWQDDSAENISEQYYDTQSRLETAQIKLVRACRSCSKRRRIWRTSSPSSPPSLKRSMRSNVSPARCATTTRSWTMRPLRSS